MPTGMSIFWITTSIPCGDQGNQSANWTIADSIHVPQAELSSERIASKLLLRRWLANLCIEPKARESDVSLTADSIMSLLPVNMAKVCCSTPR